MITPLRTQVTPTATAGSGSRAAPIEDIHQQDDVITADGIRLGTVQGLYETGVLQGHLLVQGPGDLPGTTAVYTIPLHALARIDPAARSAQLSGSAARVRAQWLLDNVG